MLLLHTEYYILYSTSVYPSHNATVPQLPSPSGQPAAVVLLSAAALSSSTAIARH